MEFYANEGKDVLIQANGKIYARHAITTHFVQAGKAISTLLNDMLSPSISQGISFPPARR